MYINLGYLERLTQQELINKLRSDDSGCKRIRQELIAESLARLLKTQLKNN